MGNAILIPANPKLDFGVGGNEVSIIAHAVKIEEEGAVFWRLVVPGVWAAGEFSQQDIKKGYLYDVHEKRVTHVCEVAWIKPMSSLSYLKFRKYFLGEFKNRKYFEESAELFYIVNITSIFALRRVHRPEDFLKLSDGKPVERVMNYCIVQDPEFAHHDKRVTRGEIISDRMVDLLLRGRITEKDIEDLFFYRLMKNGKIIRRQGAFRKAGRLDLLVKDRFGNYVVYELKKGVAGLSALPQIKRYIKAYAEERDVVVGKGRLSGVILAQDADPDLLEALKKDSSVDFKKYYFSIDMK